MAREVATTEYMIEFRGKRVCGIRTAWETAGEVAEAPKSLFPDLRPRAATMTIVGWKSEAMFDRYPIGSEEHAASLGRTLDARIAEKQLARVPVRRSDRATNQWIDEERPRPSCAMAR